MNLKKLVGSGDRIMLLTLPFLKERALAKTFDAAWDEYCRRVWIPWL